MSDEQELAEFGSMNVTAFHKGEPVPVVVDGIVNCHGSCVKKQDLEIFLPKVIGFHGIVHAEAMLRSWGKIPLSVQDSLNTVKGVIDVTGIKIVPA
jgi:hypothetical protein